MKINPSVSSVGANELVGRAKPANERHRSGSAEASDTVELSSLSSEMQHVPADGAAIDAARVAEIKQAISEGRFRIDTGRIADGLIDSVREMLVHQGK